MRSQHDRRWSENHAPSALRQPPRRLRGRNLRARIVPGWRCWKTGWCSPRSRGSIPTEASGTRPATGRATRSRPPTTTLRSASRSRIPSLTASPQPMPLTASRVRIRSHSPPAASRSRRHPRQQCNALRRHFDRRGQPGRLLRIRLDRRDTRWHGHLGVGSRRPDDHGGPAPLTSTEIRSPSTSPAADRRLTAPPPAPRSPGPRASSPAPSTSPATSMSPIPPSGWGSTRAPSTCPTVRAPGPALVYSSTSTTTPRSTSGLVRPSTPRPTSPSSTTTPSPTIPRRSSSPARWRRPRGMSRPSTSPLTTRARSTSQAERSIWMPAGRSPPAPRSPVPARPGSAGAR